MGSYYKWGIADDASLFLQLFNPADNSGVIGASPEVAIRRHRDVGGNPLDNFYWNGTIFTATPTFLSMSQLDPTNSPGLYTYFYEQSLIGLNQTYLAYYRNTASPVGFSVEEHVFSNEIFIPASSPVVPVAPGDTVMGKIVDMEDPTKPVALANADANWDENLGDHLLPGSTGEALSKCAAVFLGIRQIDITVEDGSAVPIQGTQVDVYDATNTNFLLRVFTDLNGEVSIALDDGTFNLRLFASGFSFTVPEVLVVSADSSETFVGSSAFTISPPSSPNLCVIFGTILDAAGNPVAGADVDAFAITPQDLNNIQSGNRVANARTDENGFFEIELIRQTEVNFVIEAADIRFTKTVPDLGAQDITTWP